MNQGNRRTGSQNDLPTVSGVVHFIEQTKSFGAKGFRKRTVVLEQDNGRFVNYIPVEFLQDACDTIDELSVGDEIEVRYRLSGRKWQKDASSEVKYFLSAEAMGFTRLGGGGKGGGARTAAGRDSRDANSALAEVANDDDQDVPF